jgi:hypothetical protein
MAQIDAASVDVIGRRNAFLVLLASIVRVDDIISTATGCIIIVVLKME